MLKNLSQVYNIFLSMSMSLSGAYIGKSMLVLIKFGKKEWGEKNLYKYLMRK